MNFHQRSFSEQPQPLRPQQSPSFLNNLNNNNNNNGPSATMDTTKRDPTATGGEILHSDSQQSLDRLFNPASMPSYTPLRDRNLPASFFNPPWKANNRDNDDQSQNQTRDNPMTFHSRSVSFDHRSVAPQHRRVNNHLHMRTQSTLAPMKSLMSQQTSASPSVIQSGPPSNGNLNSDFGSAEYISSPQHSNGLHRSTEFSAQIHDPNQSHSQQQQQQRQQNHFLHQNDQTQQPFVANRASIIHGHHNQNHIQQHQPVTSNGLDGQFVENNQYHQQRPHNNNVTDHHVHNHEPKFHVAHSTYVTPRTTVIQNNQQQHLHSPAAATVVHPFNTTNQLRTTVDGFSSSGSTVSQCCSNSDFHSGSCSSLHSRSQSCQSSVLDSSMSNLGISGSSNDLTRPQDPSLTQMFDYGAAPTPVVHQRPQMPYNGSYDQPVQHQQQQQQIFSHQNGCQTAMNHHQQHFNNQLPIIHQQQAPMEERRCGYY